MVAIENQQVIFHILLSWGKQPAENLLPKPPNLLKWLISKSNLPISKNTTPTVRRLVLIGIPSVLATMLITQIFVSILNTHGIKLGTPDKKWISERQFCEEFRLDSNIYQPVNAWSAFIYNLIGLLSLYLIPPPASYTHNLIFTSWAVLYLFCGIYVYLGIASFYYHASFTYISGIMDFSSISLLSSYFVAFSVTRWFGRGSGFFIMLFSVLAPLLVAMRVVPDLLFYYDATIPVMILFLGGAFFSEMVRQVLFRRWGARRVDRATGNLKPVALVQTDLESGTCPSIERQSTNSEIKATILSENLYIEDWGWLAWALTSMVLAIVVWELDMHKVICYPREPFQLHAVWHALTGYSGIFFFFYANMFRIGKDVDVKN
ncbi:hypothetical protein HK098_007555 [Nowakowskiella sp. JEL0407]|nr:hypothetical protein HK098_007555 [Nowakowskiella sp. JEL0407]